MIRWYKQTRNWNVPSHQHLSLSFYPISWYPMQDKRWSGIAYGTLQLIPSPCSMLHLHPNLCPSTKSVVHQFHINVTNLSPNKAYTNNYNNTKSYLTRIKMPTGGVLTILRKSKLAIIYLSYTSYVCATNSCSLDLDIGIPWKSPPLVNTLSTNALQPWRS